MTRKNTRDEWMMTTLSIGERELCLHGLREILGVIFHNQYRTGVGRRIMYPTERNTKRFYSTIHVCASIFWVHAHFVARRNFHNEEIHYKIFIIERNSTFYIVSFTITRRDHI